MRIVGGTARGLTLAPVGAGDAAAHLRPTSDRVREAIFNLLTNGRHARPLAGLRVLDLFAGTGALGLEALSRGAAHATFVDTGRAAQALVARNIALMRVRDQTALRPLDVTALPLNDGAAFDLVFVDPPYGKGLGGPALSRARAGRWLAPDAMIVWEEAAPPDVPPGFDLLDQRRYGSTTVTLLRASAPSIISD